MENSGPAQAVLLCRSVNGYIFWLNIYACAVYFLEFTFQCIKVEDSGWSHQPTHNPRVVKRETDSLRFVIVVFPDHIHLLFLSYDPYPSYT